MKRGKTGKKVKQKTRRKGSLSSDNEQVPVSTTLPPAVQGQLRCFLTVSVSKFTWAVEKHPRDVEMRMCWWGEEGQGTVLRPLVTDQVTQKGKWTLVRYPVCSGPKQFAAYLNDMGTLLLEAVHTSTHIPFGKALVSEITQLTASQPINVIVPIMSVISPFNKLADIQVYIKFESVSAAYSKLSSTIPTVDTGLDKENVDFSNPQPTPPPYLNPATPVSHPRQHKDAKDPFESPAPLKGVKFSEEPPERLEYTLEPSLLSLLEHDYTQSERSDIALSHHSQDVGTMASTEFDQNHTTHTQGTGPEQGTSTTATEQGTSEMSLDGGSMATDSTDWIGALLERGQRLREGLAMSTLLDDNVPGSFVEHHRSPDRHVLPGRLFKEILSTNTKDAHDINLGLLHQALDDQSTEYAINSEDKVIDLLMGAQHDVEFMENMSDISQELSELGDPLHDESLLMDLFYKSQLKKSDDSDDDNSISTEEDLDSTLTNGSIEEDKLSPKEHPTHHKKKKSKEKKPAPKQITVEDEANESSLQSSDPPTEISDQSEIMSTTPRVESAVMPVSGWVQQLGADTLTTLGRINTARVIIGKLEVNNDYVHVMGNQSASKKTSTFFVEYYFPIASTKDTVKSASMATEVTRVASKKTHKKAVLFNHRSVFPVSFNASVLEQWCDLGMAFRIFKRESGQRQPLELGVGVFPLKAVLSSSSLSHAYPVEVKDQVFIKQRGSTSGTVSSQSTPPSVAYHPSDTDSSMTPSRTSIIGTLEVTVELGVDGKEVHVAPCSTSITSTHGSMPTYQSTTTVSMVSRPVVISCSQSQHQDTQEMLISKPPLPSAIRPHSSIREPSPIGDPADVLTLHSLLWIQEGKGVTLEPHGSHGVPGISARTNLFLVSRMFWCEEVSKSAICWGTNNPHFGFRQVAPVLVTPTLLQRTCNNFMVIEVWDKVIPHGEQLIGIVKLPLHQLYLSYRDPNITKTLIKSKFPVVCIDEMLSIRNPFTGTIHGELKVVLAMGTEEQISSLLAIKDGSGGSGDGRGGCDSVLNGLHNRPLHHLDQQREPKASQLSGPSSRKSHAIDHQFEMTVGDIRGLSVFKSTVWGETDCYVQYHFPHQHQTTEDLDTEVIPGLKSHHTPTTLCVPDPSFQDVTRHSFILPSGIPVQRYLLAAYSGSWTGVSYVPGSGGVPFELWRRYYYPNVRDQLVAKASLPVAKLCAMVTMQKHREPSIQTFSLPLVVLPDEHGTKHDSGLLEITAKYQAKRVQPAENVTTKHGDDQVSLSVDIMRACGLKDAAMTHAHTNPNMSYPSDVGINAYVIIKLPIGRKTRHITRTVARTFAPDFSHHLDIMVPLQMTRKSRDTDNDHGRDLVCLAERLEMTEAVFEVWHQHSGGFGNIESHGDGAQHTKNRKHDVLLGVVSIAMSKLLTHRTGIRGWHALKPADTNLDTSHADQAMSTNISLGGLQLSIKFEDPEDRDAVLHAGRSVGWSPPPWLEYDDDVQLFGSGDDEDGDDHYPKGLDLGLKINRAWIPVSLVHDLQGHQSSKNIKGYVRYKLYDKHPVCSRVVPIRQTDKELSILEVKHSKSSVVPTTASLVWYLREESLEAQVWVRGQTRKDDAGAVLPGQRDKLVGSAFIDLSSLVVSGLQHSQISGVFPLFKAGADALDGASVHVQISLAKPNSHHQQLEQQDTFDDTLSSDDYPSTRGFAGDESTSFKSSSGPHPSDDRDINYAPPHTPPRSTAASSDDNDTFAGHVIVQEARHLSTVLQNNGERVPPNACVSYQTSASSPTICTPVIKSSRNPVWEYQKLERLPLSTLKTQNLVFKVWHRPDHTNDGTPTKLPSKKKTDVRSDIPSGDYGLGFASVDLAPLAAGLRQLIGWYNIMDFNGECKGQIKVGVVPLAPVSPSRYLSRSRINVSPPVYNGNKPLPTQFMSNSEQTSVGNASEMPSSQPESFHYRSLSHPDIGVMQEAKEKDTMMFTHREQLLPQTATSTSFLFRQLRQNMQDLDNLQKDLQAKLNRTSPDYNRKGLSRRSEEVPISLMSSQDFGLKVGSTHFSTSRQDTNEVMVDTDDKEQPATDDTGDIPSTLSNTVYTFEKRPITTTEQIDFRQINKGGRANFFEPETTLDMEKAAGDNFPGSFGRDPLLLATEGVSSSDSTDVASQTTNSGMNATGNGLVVHTDQRLIHQEDHLQECRQTDGSLHSGEKEPVHESDLDHDSDSIEEVSSYCKANTQSPLQFTQDIDSWLSSPEEDEETKSPLHAQAFFFTDDGDDMHTSKHLNQKTDNTVDGSETSLKVNDDTATDDIQDNGIVKAMDVFTAEPKNHCDSHGEDHNVVKEDFLQNEGLADDELTTGSNSPIDSRITDHRQENVVESTNEPGTDSGNKPKAVCLPNFFMPTQQLENSMRALRLGAKLGYPHSLTNSLPQSRLLERTYRDQHGEGNNRKETEGILSQYSHKKVLYKAKQDMQPPLSSIEIDRIARIFSSKDK